MNTPTIDELTAALDAAKTGTPEKSIESAIMVYQAAQAVIDAYAAIKEGAKALITDVMSETGCLQYGTPAGRVSVTAPSVTVTYDAKALDVVCRTNPQIAELLMLYRKETQRAGTLRITAAK